jgi:hypothetical protein
MSAFRLSGFSAFRLFGFSPFRLFSFPAFRLFRFPASSLSPTRTPVQQLRTSGRSSPAAFPHS